MYEPSCTITREQFWAADMTQSPSSSKDVDFHKLACVPYFSRDKNVLRVGVELVGREVVEWSETEPSG
jgi:hypothetical protein